MNRKDIGKELAQLGKSDKRLMTKLTAIAAELEANRARRCEILTQVGRSEESGIDIGTMATFEEKD